MSEESLNLEEWLIATQHRRDELAEFGKSKLPVGVSSSEDMDIAIQAQDDTGRLLADAEGYLIMHTAKEVLAAKADYPDLSVEERKHIVKDKVRDIKRLVDGISVTHGTIKSRIFAILNSNRSR